MTEHEPADTQTPDMQTPDAQTPDTRRASLRALIFVVLLIGAALLLVRVLHSMAQEQDCAISGRSNCALDPTSPGG